MGRHVASVHGMDHLQHVAWCCVVDGSKARVLLTVDQNVCAILRLAVRRPCADRVLTVC